MSLALISSAVGGGVLGPALSSMLKGNAGVGLVGGILGGVAAHFGMPETGVAQNLLGNSELMIYLQQFLQGGAGGGILGIIAGLVMKK